MGTHPIFESDFDCLTEFERIEIIMPTHGMAAKLFPRGGTLVSKSQKDKKMMKKVRKQVGKKADLFSQQSKKTIKKVGEAQKKKRKKGGEKKKKKKKKKKS